MESVSHTGGIRAKPQPLLLCPYCGSPTPPGSRCAACRGLLDPLSRQASQNAMGPWFIRDDLSPFMPGRSYETLVTMVKRGKITRRTVLRGPTTRQFWCTAERTPGISHFLGVCHNCRVDVQPTDSFCDECGAGFTVETDRQHLGLGAVHLLPGQAAPEAIAGAGRESAVDESTELEGAVAPAAPIEAADFGPLVIALRRKVRRQRWLIALMLLGAAGAAAAAAWTLVPPGAVTRWLDGYGIRFGQSPPPSPFAVPDPVRSPEGERTVEPEKPSIPEAENRSTAPREPTSLPAQPSDQRGTEAPPAGVQETSNAPDPGSEPDPPGRAPSAIAAPDHLPESVLSLALSESSEELAAAAAGLQASPALRSAVERRRVQVLLRRFP